MLKQITLALALALTSATALADRNPLRSQRIPQGRGSFLVVQLPSPAAEQAPPYALTGESPAAPGARMLQIPLGRGQSMALGAH